MTDRTWIPQQPIGDTGLSLPPLGFGAFKIGRNEGIKYPAGYDLPSEPDVERLLNRVLDMGCKFIDTAPAYGLSEERIGRHLAKRRAEFVLSTKVGETFAEGKSTFDFSEAGIRGSIERSRARLQADVLDIVLIHSPGNDREILEATPVVEILSEYRDRGVIRAIGLSGKTVEGARRALTWADVLMLEFHVEDRAHECVIAEAQQANVAVIVKKGLGSGRLPPDEAIPFALAPTGVTSLVVGSLNADHFQDNWDLALRCRRAKTA